MQGKPLVGIDRDRTMLRASAMRIIRTITELPLLPDRGTRQDWLRPPPLSAYQRLEPLGFGMNTDDDWWAFRPEDCLPDLVWPLNVGLAANAEDGIAFSRTYTVTPKQTRGYASRFGPFMVRHDFAQMDQGKLVRGAGLYVWLGGQWTDAQKRTLWSGASAEKAIPDVGAALSQRDREQPRLATSIALRQRYEWAVALGLDLSPTIRFATDPTGIKDLFRIRDLPEGRDRRDQLMTWVTDHWRQERVDPDMEVYVRKHLRGATQFRWQGMSAELLPAQFDLDQRDKLRAEREAMREAGIDHRPSQR